MEKPQEFKNPVKSRNEWLDNHFKHHLCRHCKYMRYWDWYYCQKRKIEWWEYSIKENLSLLWKRFKDLIYDEVSWKFFKERIFEIHENNFIPNKPIKKCKSHEYEYRKYFSTRIMRSDGTVWNAIDDEPERVGGGWMSWEQYDRENEEK